MAALDAQRDALREQIDTLKAEGIHVVGIYRDIKANRVRMTITSNDPAEHAQLEQRFGPLVTVGYSSPMQTFASRRNYKPVPPIPAGLQIKGSYPGSMEPIQCSSGFSMRDTRPGRGYRLLTAGHCGVGADQTWFHTQQPRPDLYIGRPVDNLFTLVGDSDNARAAIDAMQIKVRAAMATGRILVNAARNAGSDSNPPRYYRALRQVKTSELPHGYLVCAVGFRASRQRCGELLDGSFEATDEQNLYIGQMPAFRQPRDPIKHGDSGGAVYRYSSALGIISQGNDEMILFTKLQTISETMHSQLVSNDP